MFHLITQQKLAHYIKTGQLLFSIKLSLVKYVQKHIRGPHFLLWVFNNPYL